jgi:hypothetical protein
MNTQEIDRWFRNPGDLEVWEDIASWFQKETGHLRPGKDKAPGWHQCAEGEVDCCQEAWLTWTEAKRLDAQRSLKAERDRCLKALMMIHQMGNESSLIDAQMATTMVLYPETYGPEANKAWGLN